MHGKCESAFSRYGAWLLLKLLLGGRGGRTTPLRPQTPAPTSNYRVPPAHRFHKYKLRLLYFRMQNLTPYSIKFIKKNLEEHAPCPQTLLGRHCTDGARHPPPPQPINDLPLWSTLGTGLNFKNFVIIKIVQ